MEGRHGPAQVGHGLGGRREVITGTAAGTTTGGENHLVTQVLLGVPRPAVNTGVSSQKLSQEGSFGGLLEGFHSTPRHQERQGLMDDWTLVGDEQIDLPLWGEILPERYRER